MSTPYIPFYTSDFLGGTSGMTASTKGIYITLLCLMYETEGPLPQKWDSLSRRCGCTLPAFKKAIEALSDEGKITVLDDGLWSPKCEKHITLRVERSNSAKASAEKRWEKTKQKQGQSDANAMRETCQSEPEPKPDIREEPKGSLCGFDDFWGFWPSKIGKDDARKAWRKLSIDLRREAFVAVRAGWFDRWQNAHPDANPIHASTFMNKKRWQDEFPTPQLKAITGDRYDQPPSKSAVKQSAFVGGAAATS